MTADALFLVLHLGHDTWTLASGALVVVSVLVAVVVAIVLDGRAAPAAPLDPSAKETPS